MATEANDTAPAAIADPIVSTPAASAEVMATPEVAEIDVAAPEAAAPERPAPDAVIAKPKGKPGRPRKVIAPMAPIEVAPVAKAPKPAKVSKAKSVTKPVTPPAAATVAATDLADVPAPRKPVKATEILIKTRKPVTALPRIAATNQKERFPMTATTTEMTESMQTAMKDAAEKAKAALEKSQAALGDMSAFTKGNMEAVVSAGKILATGLQEMSKSYVAESKSVVETMTAEIKDLASVKSPTEFFEKQSAMLRKQFDAAVAASSKNSEAMLKLASEAFQPISNRVSIAVEKIKQAA